MVWSAPAGEVLIDIVTRPGQTEHGQGNALAYGVGAGGAAKPARAAPPPAAPYPPHYPPHTLRLQPGYGSAALSYREGSYGRGGGAAEYRGASAGAGAGAGSRMSLLGSGYLPPPAPPAHHPPPADPPPFKKIRLTAERQPPAAAPPQPPSAPPPAAAPAPVSHHHQPLRIDTREPMNTYTVEVLSPNPPSEPTIEDQNFRTTKDDLLQQISKVDREMALSESTLNKLKKKQKELEEAARGPARIPEPEEQPTRHRSLAESVYAENAKKAASAHGMLPALPSQRSPAPLYNQPQDTEIYHINVRRHRLFRRRLTKYVQRIRAETRRREEALASAYTTRAAEWARRVERIEQGQKKKAKEARNREFFEKVFPELRKQREERERFHRLGARVKSEAELEEIADGLHEQEHEDKKMRSLTVVPPLLLDAGERKLQYIDTNRRCTNMEVEHKALGTRNVWSTTEREVFREKYLQHPKNFGLIASFLPRKSVQDCVRFYYLSKKAENYKQLLRKPRQRRQNRPRPAPEPELPAGVTTRLQRSQGGTGARPADKESAEDGPPQVVLSGDAVLGIPVPPDIRPPSPAQPGSPQRMELTRTPPLPPSPPPAAAPAPAAPASAPPSPSPAPAPARTPPVPAVSPSPDIRPAADPATAPENAAVERLNTPTAATPGHTPTPTPSTTPAPPPTVVLTMAPTTGSTTSGICAVCETSGATRSVSRARAHHYGLREEAAAAGARVCESCHCRCVRSRYTRCPVPTCPGPRVRAKRLRHLPPRWHDLALEHKRPIMDEFQIPSELTKCCLACFKRITRRLETAGEPGAVGEPTDDEVSRFRSLLREHGTAWDRMAAAAGRTPASLKAFYFSYRKRFQLDTAVACEPAAPAATVVSDSDESALSSGDTDTASAESPRPPPPPMEPAPHAARHTRRDEYDSSATETADEENDAPSTRLPPATCLPSSTSLSAATSSVQRNGPAALTTAAVTLTASSAPMSVSAPAPASLAHPSPVSTAMTTTTTPLTVRDVVLNMIEISLKKPPPKPPVKGTSSPSGAAAVQPHAPREALATLSVVNSGHAPAAPRSPHRPATITPLAQPPPPAPDAPKEGYVVLQIESRNLPEPCLDLSVKRPRADVSFPQPNKPTYRGTSEYAYRGQERESPTGQYKAGKPASSPRGQLKPAAAKGSITLGTPVEGRFEARRTPPDAKPGSITAGTPVHVLHHLPEKRAYDYYKRRSPGGLYYGGGAGGGPAQPRAHSPSYSPAAAAAAAAGYARSPYGLEQRQIIMADFITSQQMHGAARRDRTASPQPQPQYSHSPQPGGAGQGAGPQRREPVSVIQRHTPHHYASHHPPPPPGHEAFTSLVDVASAATALPVPRGQPPDKDKPPAAGAQHQQPQPNHMHHDIRMQQERMAIAHKYHQQQIHYQVLERDRQQRAQQQAQYIERDRQIALQQGRERERALVAMQERQIALEQHQHQQQQQQHQQQQQQHQQQQQQHQQQQHQQQQHQQQQQQQHQHQQQQHQQHQHQQQQQQHQQHQHQQHQAQHQSQLIHDRHHMSVVSEDNGRRLLTTATYATAKHRAPAPAPAPPPPANKDGRPTSVSGGMPGGAVAGAGVAGVAAAGADARGRAEGKLTAASLIDAIITHQISQTSEQRFPQTVGRECDNGASAAGAASAPVPSSDDPAAPPPGHTTSIKLGDLASNIITRDFCAPPNPTIVHHNSRFVQNSEGGYTIAGGGGVAGAGAVTVAVSKAGGAGEEWPRRDPPKHAPYLEPVSPPDNHHANRNNNNRRYSSAGGVGVGVGGASAGSGAGAGSGVLTAFDYVTNRIVEVMRHDADERKPPLAFPTAPYAYPYSALNVATGGGGGEAGGGAAAVSAPAPAHPHPPPVAPEPAPIMSAQYEPLSDED